jgi:hypothetical protein
MHLPVRFRSRGTSLWKLIRSIVPTLCLLLVATGLATGGCTERQPSYILESGCAVPCWRGIIPGETSIEDAVEIIKQIPEVSLTSISVRDQGVGIRYASWVMGPAGDLTFGEIIAENETVSTVSLSLDREVPLADLFLAYGEPISAGGFYGWGEGHWRRVFIHFDQGAVAVLSDYGWPHTDTWRLRSTDHVKYLYLFRPDSLADPPEGDWLLRSALWPSEEAFSAAARPWQGYATLTLQFVR